MHFPHRTTLTRRLALAALGRPSPVVELRGAASREALLRIPSSVVPRIRGDEAIAVGGLIGAGAA